LIDLLFNTPEWASVENLSDDQLAAMSQAGVPLIDIRREQEWEETGVIAGSHLITFFRERDKYDLDGWLGEFDKVADRDRPFILICRHGIRTAKLGRYLAGREDFSHVHHLRHGITGWIEAGRPVRRYSSD
jgi:rhodanese-related sulfurtransferase